jgi:hypothetical protein
MILAANATVGVITETNAEKALEVSSEQDYNPVFIWCMFFSGIFYELFCDCFVPLIVDFPIPYKDRWNYRAF